jgi:hypothetical protein
MFVDSCYELEASFQQVVYHKQNFVRFQILDFFHKKKLEMHDYFLCLIVQCHTC